MKAAVCYEFGKPLVIDEVAIDPPQHGEVKVRIAATAICHSDVHVIRGDWGGDVPVVLGHESAGVVEAVGEYVTHVKAGDHVVVSLLRSCGRCFFCATGSSHLCEAAWALDEESRLRNSQGQRLQQGLRVGGFAQYAIVDQSQVVVVPNELPLDRAALLACGVITGAGAVINTAQVRPGTSVVVIGSGGVGLNSIQGARLVGAHPIIAVDVVKPKLKTAMQFGATHTVDATEQDVVAVVQSLTGGRGADFAVVTVGSDAAVEQAFAVIRAGGTAVIAGLPRLGATAAIDIHRLVVYERKVIGSVMGSTRLSVDVPHFVELYQQGRMKLDELITERYPLEAINEAISAMEHGQALRNVIMF